MLTQPIGRKYVTQNPGSRRRIKAALSLCAVYSCVGVLHVVPLGRQCVWGLGAVMVLHALRLICCRLRRTWAASGDYHPSVSLLVSAKNEELVIERLVEQLTRLDYAPLEVWVVNDASTDRTGEILTKLQQEYDQLRVLHRPPNSPGGKSGALNQVLHLSQGEIIGVFDADAQIAPDALNPIVGLFAQENIGAVQLRKSIANRAVNFLTRGQASEMAMDLWLQEHRVGIGGLGELRGNGQFVRRSALLECGGWNEHTITDDLDLTFRLHLNGWDIACLLNPAVEEEGVLTFKQLWHQRNRWAEGGYQRYLDYFPYLGRIKGTKGVDLWLFFLSQYLLPTASVPDAVLSIGLGRFPLLLPLVIFSLMLSFVAMVLGIRRAYKTPWLRAFGETIAGTIYILHWIPVMTSVTLRMAIRPKRLKWVKTEHLGQGS